jgi:hypothetical protein
MFTASQLEGPQATRGINEEPNAVILHAELFQLRMPKIVNEIK